MELECVIGPAHLQRAKGGLLRLTAPELARIEQLIKAAEKGEDVTKLDPGRCQLLWGKNIYLHRVLNKVLNQFFHFQGLKKS